MKEVVSVVREGLTRGQQEILDLIAQFPGKSRTQLSKKVGVSSAAVLSRMKYLEPRYIKTLKRGQETLAYLVEDFPHYLTEETDCPLPSEPQAKLMRKYSLDELEWKMLFETKSEAFEAIAVEFKELPMQVRARLGSIPVKLEVQTLSEAREKIRAKLAALN